MKLIDGRRGIVGLSSIESLSLSQPVACEKSSADRVTCGGPNNRINRSALQPSLGLPSMPVAPPVILGVRQPATQENVSVGEDPHPLECVAALVLKQATVLAEERKPTKTVVPGVVALPGGHVEPGEGIEDALRRELKEELGIAPLQIRYVCTLLHRSAEFRKLHYYAIPQWAGKVENHEAASLQWVPLNAPHHLDLEVDRFALAEYQRVYGDP